MGSTTFNAVDFSKCRSIEARFLLTLTVHVPWGFTHLSTLKSSLSSSLDHSKSHSLLLFFPLDHGFFSCFSSSSSSSFSFSFSFSSSSSSSSSPRSCAPMMVDMSFPRLTPQRDLYSASATKFKERGKWNFHIKLFMPQKCDISVWPIATPSAIINNTVYIILVL